MTTVRQIQRHYQQRQYNRLITQLLGGRIEHLVRLQAGLEGQAAAAAMAIIRMDELNQPQVPFYSDLVKDLVRLQQPDGGWGGLGTTAIVLRALLLGGGRGQVIDRGLRYLAELQKSEGIWPSVPVRRTQADPVLSAFVLLQLCPDPAFRASVRIDDAMAWFSQHGSLLDPVARRLWDSARLRRTGPRMYPPAGPRTLTAA
jgi:hypothetical protein